MIKRNFDPGFRIELHQKDLNLALSGARALERRLPNTATCQELFNACAAHGGAAWDHSGHGPGAGADGQLRDRSGRGIGPAAPIPGPLIRMAATGKCTASAAAGLACLRHGVAGGCRLRVSFVGSVD